MTPKALICHIGHQNRPRNSFKRVIGQKPGIWTSVQCSTLQYYWLFFFMPQMLPALTLLTVGFGPPLHPWIFWYALNIFNKTSTLDLYILVISFNRSVFKSSENLDWSSMCWMRMTYIVIMGLSKASSSPYWLPTCWALDLIWWLACHWNKRWACCCCRESCYQIFVLAISSTLNPYQPRMTVCQWTK